MESSGEPKRSHFHLPWHHTSQEQEISKDAEKQRRAELDKLIDANRESEAVRQAADLRLLGGGGIPAMATQRLATIRGTDPQQTFFSSDLSPAESALLRRNGYRSLGLVSGSAMYHVGIVHASGSSDSEMRELSAAYTSATGLAVSRMQQEASAVGAQGVIGVRFDIVRREWSAKSIEVRVLGTAVAGPDRALSTPWLSDLSGQDWWALHRAGYHPIALVYGHCAWFVLTAASDEWNERSVGNTELSHFSAALTQCRNRASSAAVKMGQQLQAIGIVGVHYSRHVSKMRLYGPDKNPAYEREHHSMMLSMIGTAIRLRPDAPATIRATGTVLSLGDGRLMPSTISIGEATFD